MALNYPKLSEGSIAKINAKEKVEKPVLQILIYKQMANNNNQQMKYRFQLSDGIESGNTFIVVLPELIQRISQGEFEKYTVIQLNSYTTQNHQQMERQIIIINDMSVVMPGAKICKKLEKNESNVGFLANVNQNTENRNLGNRSMFSGSPSMSSSMATSTTTSMANNSNVCPITAITPYYNAWLIKGRVTHKSNKRNYSNAKGEGCVFSFNVMDQSGEIRINCFNSEANKFYDLIQLNKVFYISKGSVRTANKKFSNLANDYEITLNNESTIKECDDLSADLPKMRYKFISIKDLDNIQIKTIVDVIGIVRNIGECVSITSRRTNKELKKRDITLLDKSCHEVVFTLWNESAETFDCDVNTVLAIKNAIVGDFNGKNLSSVMDTTLQIEPEIPETNLLKEWFSREGSNITTIQLTKGSEGFTKSNFKYLCQINEQTVDENRKYFNVTATVVQTGRTPLYKACGQNNCNKKVSENNGLFHCDKCQTDSPQFVWRIILAVVISDSTSEKWVTLFQEEALKLIGRDIEELSELQENNPQQFLRVISTAEFKKFDFNLSSRIEQYMDDRRVKSTVYSFAPINPIKRSKHLLKIIKQFG